MCNSFIQSEYMHIELLYKVWPKSLLKVMFLLKGSDKAITILQNAIKVIVITPTQTPILRTTDWRCIILHL